MDFYCFIRDSKALEELSSSIVDKVYWRSHFHLVLNQKSSNTFRILLPVQYNWHINSELTLIVPTLKSFALINIITFMLTN